MTMERHLLASFLRRVFGFRKRIGALVRIVVARRRIFIKNELAWPRPQILDQRRPALAAFSPRKFYFAFDRDQPAPG